MDIMDIAIAKALSGGGGGGGGGGSALVVHFTFDDETAEVLADKTCDEIFAAYENNQSVTGTYMGAMFSLNALDSGDGYKVVSFAALIPITSGTTISGLQYMLIEMENTGGTDAITGTQYRAQFN